MNEHGICFVRHHAAGGQCGQPATIEVYGLNFCEPHGEEIRTGALLQEHHEAGIFFERFDSQHVPAMKGLIGRELEAAAARLREESPTDDDHARALERAYKSGTIPDDVYEYLDYLEEDGAAGRPTLLDMFLDRLGTLHRLMRIAHEDGEADLVEMLEVERELAAACAAVADDRQSMKV